MNRINTQHVKDILIERPIDLHKGQAGRVLIIAGKRGMAGAAVLAARGCLYSGAGLVKIGVPDDIMDILQITVPEAMCLDRSELYEDDIRAFDAVAIGPGTGVNEESYRLVCMLLKSCSCPVVLDADALTCIARYGMPEKNCGDVIMTPHPGEADRLINGLGISIDGKERTDIAKAIAKETGTTVLLKGHETVISSPEGELFLNPTGNPGMATGGSGDVLTGIITALLAGKYLNATALDAACAGAFIHGLAGNIAAENIGEYGMTSADIADAVSVALKEIMSM